MMRLIVSILLLIITIEACRGQELLELELNDERGLSIEKLILDNQQYSVVSSSVFSFRLGEDLVFSADMEKI